MKLHSVLHTFALTALTLLSAAPAFAANGEAEAPFRFNTAVDGLTQSSVVDIEQDQASYLWFTTARGLNRYDGKEFDQYTIADGVPTNSLTALHEDSDARHYGMSVELDEWVITSLFDRLFAHHAFEAVQRKYWINLSVDTIKIDGSFIRNLLKDDTNRIFVKSIIDIAHTLNIKVVAEFVEGEKTLEAVRELGADYFQEFMTGRPLVFAPRSPKNAGSAHDHTGINAKAG